MDFKIIFAAIIISFFSLISGTPVVQQKYTVKNLPDPHIVGGDIAPEGYAKHMVALLVGDYISFVTCGGSLISRTHVLTAAHCVDSYIVWGQLLQSFRGAIGSNTWNAANTIISFNAFSIHPGWSWETLKNDIAILTVDKEISFNDRIAPVTLNLDFTDGRVESFVTGWGNLELFGKTPDKLMILYLTTLSNKECSVRMWLAAIVEDGRPPPFHPDVEICTLHSVGRGMCHGDSGSALVDAATGRQSGVVSWGFPCARGHPDVYVRLSAYKDYIRGVVGDLG